MILLAGNFCFCVTVFLYFLNWLILIGMLEDRVSMTIEKLNVIF